MMSGALETALDYIRRDWSPIPVGYREKKPTLKGWPSLKLGTRTLACISTAPCKTSGHSRAGIGWIDRHRSRLLRGDWFG
jgi:hypothetical protein